MARKRAITKQGTTTTGKPKWTPQQMEVLCDALDDIARAGSSTVDRTAEYVEIRLAAQLEPGDSGPAKPEILYKLREVAQQVGTTAGRLVKEWVQHKDAVKKTFRPATSSPKPRSSRAPTQPVDDPTTKSGDHTGHGDGTATTETADRSPADADESHARTQPDEQPQHRVRPTRIPKNPNDLTVRDYEYIQEELMDTWQYTGHNRRFTEAFESPETQAHFDSILQDIETGVEAFCKAHPFTDLTASKLTSSSLELARKMVLGPKERSAIEPQLRTLFGDPFLTKEIVLRAFAAAAITYWVFNRPFGTLAPDRPSGTQSSLNGRFLDVCKKRFPRLVEALEVEDQLAYLDTVVKPALPGLARQYQSDLFDIFFSLRAAPSPPGPCQPSGLEQTPLEGGWLVVRTGHQAAFQNAIERAFLDALQLRLAMLMNDPSFHYEVQYFESGFEFDEERMKVSSHEAIDRNLLECATVLISLSPTITMIEKTPCTTNSKHTLPALVMLEGFAIDTQLVGYPAVPMR